MLLTSLKLKFDIKVLIDSFREKSEFVINFYILKVVTEYLRIINQSVRESSS